MAENLLTFREVFKVAPKLPSKGGLYMPQSPPESWTLETRGAILAFPTDSEDVNDVPFARTHGLKCALHLAGVQDIISNARLQRKKVDEATLLKAFLFYLDRDAFIDLAENP